MIIALTQIEQCEEICRLSGRGEHGCTAAFQRGNLRSDIIIRGILQPGIKVSGRLQIKQLSHLRA